MVVALLAGLLLITAIPQSNAESSDTSNIELKIDPTGLDEYYVQGSSIEINSYLQNNGNDETIHNNPSCDVIFAVYDTSENLIYDSQNNCRNQVQSLFLKGGEIVNMIRAQSAPLRVKKSKANCKNISEESAKNPRLTKRPNISLTPNSQYSEAVMMCISGNSSTTSPLELPKKSKRVGRK